MAHHKKHHMKHAGRVGSKRQVFNGTAMRTPGGLHKGQLIRNKRGKVVSAAKHAHGLKALKFLRR
jgi:hypothetical protein